MADQSYARQFRRPLPSYDELHRLLSYDPEIGVLTWNRLPDDGDLIVRWRNSRLAGKVAGHVHAGKVLYVVVSIKDVAYAAHRIAWKMMTGDEPDQLDHIDRNGLNNRWSNLRAVTITQNNQNRRKPKSNKTGFKNVSFDAIRNMYYVDLKVNGKRHYLGRFKTAEEAKAKLDAFTFPSLCSNPKIFPN